MNDETIFTFFNIDDDDALKIKWAHAVNSNDSLNNALNDNDIFMIESDIILSSSTNIPVMAHPPDTHSDLTFETWIQRICNWTATKKGAKADFKSIESAEIALPLISNHQQTVDNIPFWLNADICTGIPGSKQPINGLAFLNFCKRYAPPCVLSLGWTTPNILSEDMISQGGYGSNEINSMMTLLANISDNACVTFPVRAALLKGNLTDITSLMKKTCNYSLTVWTSKTDVLDESDFRALVELRRRFGKNRVFFDLPENDVLQLKALI